MCSEEPHALSDSKIPNYAVFWDGQTRVNLNGPSTVVEKNTTTGYIYMHLTSSLQCTIIHLYFMTTDGLVRFLGRIFFDPTLFQTVKLSF